MVKLSDKLVEQFKDWFDIKSKLINKTDDILKQEIFVHPGEVWWVHLGKNVGFEQDGKGSSFSRPILVLRVLSRYTFLGVPLTTGTQKHAFRVEVADFGGKPSKAVISQLRVIDIRRVQNLIGSTNAESVKRIKKAIRDMLG